MAVKYRTDGPWGVGLHADLAPSDVDNNFWQLMQGIDAKAVQGVGIANFVVSGNQLTVVLTDHTLLGPYPLPVAGIAFRGEWLPNLQYFANDILTHGGSTYIVLVNHTSAATFDPGANDGAGHDYYGPLLSNPAMTIPASGAVGQMLFKASTIDYALRWDWPTLAGLHDVLVTSPAPLIGDVLTMVSPGRWSNSTPAKTLESLSDVSITSPLANQVLTYASGEWVNATSNIGSGISIQQTPPMLPGEPLIYNGTEFTNTSTVDLPYNNYASASGTVTVDRANGEVQSLTLAGDTTLAFTGWPLGSPNRQFARLVLEIINNDIWVVTWPAIKWAGGIIPNVTTNATDLYIFFSFDGGITVYGNVVGQNYI